MRKKAFSLVEILIVIAILMILMAIVVAMGVRVSRSPSDTRLELATLKELMREYESQSNPPLTTAANADPTRDWVKFLRGVPAIADKLSEMDTLGTGDNTQILDGYGNPIRFIPADASPTKQFFFQTAGPDGQFGTDDDFFSR